MSYKFNIFTGTFDVVNDVTLTAVGSSPNSNAASIANGSVLTLQPADATNPGVITAIAQSFGGVKTFTNGILTNAIDTSSPGTLAIGTLNATTINIGNTGSTVNISGTVITETATTLNVTNPVFTVNSGGGVGSASNSGMQISENGIITGYVETSADRNSIILKAPNTAGIATITPGAGGITLNQSSHDPVTIGTANGLSLSTQSLSLGLSSTSTTGALSASDFTTFNNKGSVNSVSVVSANGLAGTVATATTTPAITLSTTITGILQGNGTAISAASTTGSGSVVLATSPTLVTPNLGTPSTLVGTNITGTATAFTASNVTTNANLTGDVTSVGNATTLATVNSNVGTFGTATQVGTVTVNAKGLVTAASNTSIQIAESQVTNLVSDLAGKQATGNYITALTGDASANGPGSVNLTLATVNVSTGTYGTSSATPTVTVNSKGLVTASSQQSIQIVESQVTNLTSDLAAKQSTTLTNAHILVGNVSNVATDVAASGDLTLSNTGAFTLGTVNSNVGSFTNASITVNAKGLITAASNGTAGTVSSFSFTNQDNVTGTVTNSTTTPTLALAPTSPTPAATSFASWDANTNLSANNHLEGYATTATAAGTTTLTVASAYQQFFTGTTTQTVQLPVTSTLVLGQSFYIVNNSTGIVTVNSSGGNQVIALNPNSSTIVTVILISGTTAASWNSSVVTGTVVSVNIPNATDWTAFTPTGLWTTNSTYTGFWRRVGDSMEVQTLVTLSGAPNAANYFPNLPAGYTIDTTKLTESSAGQDDLGRGMITQSSGNARYPLRVTYNNTTSVRVYSTNNTAPGVVLTAVLSQTAPITFATGDTVVIWYKVPISTWTTNSTMNVLGGGGFVQPTIQKFTSGSGTYTTPANVSYIKVRMVGGGGGGGGSSTWGANDGGAGGTGGNTTFGTSLLVANGGTGNSGGFSGTSTGGTASLGTGPIGTAITGASGTGGQGGGGTVAYAAAMPGASTPFGGGGGGGAINSAGKAAPTNTGAGGGGAGSPATGATGGSGAAGGYIDAIIVSPTTIYSYAIGTAGTAGIAGTSGMAGGAGGSGYIEVTEYYYNGAIGTATTITGKLTNANLTAPTVQTFTSGSGTYTTPTSPRAPLYIRVRGVGGGGGGGNSGVGASGSGQTGGITTFGSSLLTANGGVGGAATSNTAGASGGAGGTATVTTSGTVLQIIALQGGTGGGSAGVSVGAGSGGAGASSPFGGAPAGSVDAANGISAIANTGSGGAGAGGGNALAGAGGGGAGGYFESIITSPSVTYTYAIGAGGTATGAGGFAGGTGGSGFIEVTEYYQ